MAGTDPELGQIFVGRLRDTLRLRSSLAGTHRAQGRTSRRDAPEVAVRPPHRPRTTAANATQRAGESTYEEIGHLLSAGATVGRRPLVTYPSPDVGLRT